MTDRPTLATVSLSSHLPRIEDPLDFDVAPRGEQPIARTPRYSIGELIGRGGMGLVYRAHDNAFDREVALKVLLHDYQHLEDARARFFQEARTTARLQHPGVVSVYDMGISEDGQPYFAMKLVEGRTLLDVLDTENSTPLERSRLLSIFSSVCQTVAYAHSRNTVHLDLKPSNVMVGAFGEIHVMDWGLSRRLGSDPIRMPPLDSTALEAISDEKLSTVLSNSKIIGTPSYMAPEQAQGREIGIRADVFGLGALLCEILTGSPPYEGDTFRQIYRRAARGALRATYQRLEACDADPSLIALNKWCLARRKQDRPADAGFIAQAMTEFVESSMQRAERDLCRFFEISMDLFCIASLDGYFKRVNSNFSRVLGYTDSELISRPFIEFIHPDDVEQTMAAVETLAQGNPIVKFRNRYRDSQGIFRWFEWTSKSIPEDNIVFAVARVVEPACDPTCESTATPIDPID